MRVYREMFSHTPGLRVVFRYWRWPGTGGFDVRLWRWRLMVTWGPFRPDTD